MSHKISGDEIDALRVPDQRLESCPLCFQLLFASQLFAFSDLLELLVNLRQLACTEPKLGDAALIINRNRRLISDGALDVVNADVITEHGARIGIRFLDRG